MLAANALPARQLSPSVPHPLEILAIFDRLHTSCWLAGAAASDADASVRPATYANPKLVSLAVALVRSQANAFSFNSLAIFDDLRSPPHVDARNDQYAFNIVIPLSSFTGGDIVLRKQATLQALPVADGPVAFQAARYEHWVVDPSGLPPVFQAPWPPDLGACPKPQHPDVSGIHASRMPAAAVPASACEPAAAPTSPLPQKDPVIPGHDTPPSFVEICVRSFVPCHASPRLQSISH